jgi:hypothetical protein
MINLKTCNWVVWGFKNNYNTFGHVHEAFFRALKFRFPDRQVLWIDSESDTSKVDFSNTIFLTVDVASPLGLPKRADCLYAVHNIDKKYKDYLVGLDVLNYGVYSSMTDLGSHVKLFEDDAFYSSQPWESFASVMFRWGTDLLPHEIEANKPNRVFRSDSRVITYVGSVGGYYDTGINPFKRACGESGIYFQTVGGYGNSHKPGISVEENIRLIQESYIAPAICPPYQVQMGYAPCRIFKNISYGQYGVTNSAHVNELFGNRLICNSDTYKLFYDAKDQLPQIGLKQLHALMDEVAEKHTYLNKIDALLHAAYIMLGERHA